MADEKNGAYETKGNIHIKGWGILNGTWCQSIYKFGTLFTLLYDEIVSNIRLPTEMWINEFIVRNIHVL